MTCHEVIEYMQRQLDGDLDEVETDNLMKHIKHCPDCPEMYGRLQRLSAELENLPKVSPSYSLVDAIMPDLERIDTAAARQDGREEAASAYGSRAKPRKRLTDRFSFRVMSGVIAAGVVAGLFLVTNPPASLDHADQSQALESADSSNTSATGSDDSGGDQLAMEEKIADSDADRSVAAESADSSTADRAADNSAADGAANKSTDSSKLPDPSDSDGDAGSGDAPSVSMPSGGERSSNSLQHDAAVPYADGSQGNNSAGQADSKPDSGETAAPKMEVEEQSGTSMGIMAQPAPARNEALSPNGAYNTVVSDTGITVYEADAGGVLFEKNVTEGTVSIVGWSADSKTVEYRVQTPEGAEDHYVIDVLEGTEKKL
jgi:hypothetical protein